MNAAEKVKCSEIVRTWPSGNCSRNAVVERDGKPYCTIHDPVRVAEKRAERNRKWDEEWAAEKRVREEQRASEAERDRRAAAYGELVAVLDTVTDSPTPANIRDARDLLYRLRGAEPEKEVSL
jgi:uncharacterized Zn finger protein (UPF0148 family)